MSGERGRGREKEKIPQAYIYLCSASPLHPCEANVFRILNEKKNANKRKTRKRIINNSNKDWREIQFSAERRLSPKWFNSLLDAFPCVGAGLGRAIKKVKWDEENFGSASSSPITLNWISGAFVSQFRETWKLQGLEKCKWRKICTSPGDGKKGPSSDENIIKRR